MKERAVFVLTSQYSQFTHRVGDVDSLREIILGLSGDKAKAKRVASVAKNMQVGDGFSTPGILLTYEREVEYPSTGGN